MITTMPTQIESESHRIPNRLANWLGELWPSALRAQVDRAYADGWQIDAPDAYCPRCGATVGAGGYTTDGCAFCVRDRIAWDRIVRLYGYREPVSDWVVAMKFVRQWRWGLWFGRHLASQVRDTLTSGNTLVCPVPMYWLRRWRRGFNQADLIADTLAKRAKLTVAPLLTRTRYTAPQTAVVPSQRHRNVAESFAAIPVDLTGRDVLLVDDVKTTGATLSACARLLRRAGARRVDVAVVAVAAPHGDDFRRM